MKLAVPSLSLSLPGSYSRFCINLTFSLQKGFPVESVLVEEDEQQSTAFRALGMGVVSRQFGAGATVCLAFATLTLVWRSLLIVR